MTGGRCGGRKPPVSGYVTYLERFVRKNGSFHGQGTIFGQLVRRFVEFHGWNQPESKNVRKNGTFHGQGRRFPRRDMPRRMCAAAASPAATGVNTIRRSEREQVGENYRGHGLDHRRSTERKAYVVPAGDFQLSHLSRSEIERPLRPADA